MQCRASGTATLASQSHVEALIVGLSGVETRTLHTLEITLKGPSPGPLVLRRDLTSDDDRHAGKWQGCRSLARA